jgi:hypothetical protein
MEMNGQLHALAYLLPWKDPPVPSGWTPIWTPWRRKHREHQCFYNFAFLAFYLLKATESSVWVRNLVSDIKGGT